jgi:hypothetical protein
MNIRLFINSFYFIIKKVIQYYNIVIIYLDNCFIELNIYNNSKKV